MAEENYFIIDSSTLPYQKKYMRKLDYKKRKFYYIFCSYMEQLERVGGGRLVVRRGIYPVTNNICIPSHVTVELEDGVVFKKEGKTATDISYAKTLFTIVPPSLDGTKGTVREYEGSRDVNIIGKGMVIFDCGHVKNCMALAMGGARNVVVRGISFVNGYGSHFIELNSSFDVTIEKCSFENFEPLDKKSYKECINIDGNDLTTEGFNFDWSAHDKTVCKDIVIRENVFIRVGTAVGSHTFSCRGEEQLYHENVQILNNVVDGTFNSAIRALNWKNCVIQGNVFKNLQQYSDGIINQREKQRRYPGLILRGVVNPDIAENTFDTLHYYPIRIVRLYDTKSEKCRAAGYRATASVISGENLQAMQNNTVINIKKQKFAQIVIRENDKQRDSVSEKINFFAVS